MNVSYVTYTRVYYYDHTNTNCIVRVQQCQVATERGLMITASTYFLTTQILRHARGGGTTYFLHRSYLSY
jgi:hypothetical protein